MVKPYTWEEIKNFLRKELQKTKHILTYGRIGSCKIEKDIDTIITKKTNSSTSDFYKEIHSLFEKVDSYLKKNYSAKLICFNMFEPEMLKLSNKKKNDLAFHVFPYVSLGQIKRDWEPYMFKDEKPVKEFLKENYSCIFGNKKDIFSSKFAQKYYHDPLYLRLEIYDRIYSNYKEKDLVEIMNHHLDFMYRKKLNMNFNKAKDKKEIKDLFYKLCDKIDELKITQNS